MFPQVIESNLEDVVAQELIGMGKAVREDSNRAIGLKNSDGPKDK